MLRCQQTPRTPTQLPELHRRSTQDHPGRRVVQDDERVIFDGSEERDDECESVVLVSSARSVFVFRSEKLGVWADKGVGPRMLWGVAMICSRPL